MTQALLEGNGGAIEGVILPEQNRESLSQHWDGCEFLNDGEIIADWLQSKSQKTAKTYWSAIKQFQAFSDNSPIRMWSKKLILAYIESRKERDRVATINKKLSCLRSLLNHCVMEGYLNRNVALTVATVREDKADLSKQSLTATERVIGSEEIWKLINSADNQRDYLLLKTTYLLGLRAHEAVKLHWNDITPSGNGYKVKIIGKNNKVDFLPIDKQLIRELQQISTSGYIFQSRKGKNKLSTVQLHRIVKGNAIAAGLNNQISAHWLRHQRCSDLVNSGKYTLSQVQKFMRHSSPTVTSQYIHVSDEIGSDALL
jgi:integrase